MKTGPLYNFMNELSPVAGNGNARLASYVTSFTGTPPPPPPIEQGGSRLVAVDCAPRSGGLGFPFPRGQSASRSPAPKDGQLRKRTVRKEDPFPGAALSRIYERVMGFPPLSTAQFQKHPCFDHARWTVLGRINQETQSKRQSLLLLAAGGSSGR